MKLINKYPLSFILILYIFSNFLMLFNNGVFWDDWCIYNMNYNGLKELFQGTGLRFMVPLNYYLQHLTLYPSLLYHFIVFLLEILGIIIWYKLMTFFLDDKAKIFWLTAFFALIPYNEAKILMCCLQYNIGFFLFLLAILFFEQFAKHSNLIYRIVSLLLFFVSFAFLSSTLVVMLGFLVFKVVYKDKIVFNLALLKKLTHSLFCWFDFFILPFLFWIFRLVFLKPSGLYAQSGYNEISLKNVLLFPFGLFKTLQGSIIGLGRETLSSIYSIPFLFGIFMLIVFSIYFVSRKSMVFKGQFSLSINWLIIGTYFFILCSFGYIVVGKTPSFIGFDTRHQILLKICTPIVLLWFLSLFKTGKPQKIIFISVLSLFIITTIDHNISYLNSWFKQLAIENNLKNSVEAKNNRSFIVIDNNKELNETEQNCAFYCLNGISKKVFINPSRFFVTLEDYTVVQKFGINKFISKDIYNMHQYKYTNKFDYYIFIEKRSGKYFIGDTFSLLLDRFISKNHFDEKIAGIFNFRYIPIR
jgi:hypothetical protein